MTMNQMKFQFGGMSRRIDLSDADYVRRYEQAVAEYEQGLKEIGKGLSLSDQIEQICQLFFTLFDQLFGPGSHVEMFGEVKSVALCSKAFSAFLKAMERYAGQISREGAGA